MELGQRQMVPEQSEQPPSSYPTFAEENAKVQEQASEVQGDASTD